MAARIIVINEDPAFLSLTQSLLREAGYEIIELTAGASARDRVREERPDLVILDVQMDNPTKGWTLAQILLLDPDTRHIPAIICSNDSDTLGAKAAHLWSKGYGVLEKPFDREELLDQVRACLDGR